MSLLDSSIISTVVVTIGEDFQALSSINWTALAYTLSNVRCAVRFTSIGVISGWKTAYIVVCIIFYSFSVGCGFTQSLNQLIAFRALAPKNYIPFYYVLLHI